MALTPPQYKQMKQFLESDQRVTLEDGGMLVKPGFGGTRQGYATSKVKTKKFKYPFQNQFGTFYSDKKRKPFKSVDMESLKKIVDEANASDRYYTSEDISKLYAEATGRTNVTTRQTSAGKTVSYSRIPNATINQVGELLSKEDKVKKVFQEVLAMDGVVPSVDLKVYKGRPISDYKKYIVSKTGVGITNVDKIVKSLPSYKKNEKAFKYLETSRLMKTDLKDMSLSNQLKFANEAVQGRPIFIGLKNVNLSDPNYNVMDYALRSWNKTKGEGLIKFFDANNKPIKWGFGKNLPLNKVSFSQGASKQKFGIGRSNNYLNLRLVGKNYFPEVYENQNLINQLKATKVDNPFKPGTKTSFINLMKRVYIKERGYNAKAPLFSIFHGPKGVALEPFTNLSFGMQDLNKAVFDIEKSVPLKGLRKKVIDQAYGQLKGKQGEKLLNSIITQQSDIAKDVAMGKPLEGTLRKRALLETAKTQTLGTKEQTVLKELISTLSRDPRCSRGFKNQGGRVGLQDGSASLDVCFRQGVDNINRGLPNPTAAQARNFGRVAALGRNVVKFGVLPEALFVAGESILRAGMGDTLPEAILRASEYLLPGNQTKIADRMMLARTVGPKTAELILKANELRGFENQIENLENEKQFTGILTDDGFDDNFFGQTKVEEENAIQNRINALQNQKKSYKALTEAQYNFADMKAQEAEDIKKSKGLFPKLLAKARSVQPDFDDPLKEGVQQTLDLNLKMPNRFQREIDLFYRSPDVQALVNTPDQQLSNLFKGQDLENIKQLKIDTKNQLAETVSEAAAINPEAMFSASTGLFAPPLDLGVSYTPPPIDSIDEMEKEIIGQTNVANPFDLDRSSVATGLRGFSAAGGGIAKLAGVPSGPPPSSGPNSQGLQGLMKRVRNR